MPSRTVHMTITYDIEAQTDLGCDVLAEAERERWHNAAIILDGDYTLSVTEYPADGVWHISG